MLQSKSLNFRIIALFSLLAMSAVVRAAQPTPAESPALAALSVPVDYIVGPGDVVQVFVWRNPDLTATVPVRPDGKISTPLVEDMVAVGKSPTALARDIEIVLAEYVKSPQVNVIVTQPANVFSQIKVIGQVTRPGAVAYREGMTVIDAVLAAGGLSPFAAGNRARIVREDAGRRTEVRIKLNSLLNQGDMRQNVAIKPGDIIIVPESRF
jgi:polysaccharide biosynthesis/export protein